MRFMWLVAMVGWMACGNAAEPISSPPRVPEVPLRPQTFQLPNGMKVMLVTDPAADMASVLVRYRVGASDEPSGQEGVAHLAAHVSYSQLSGTVTLWDQLDRLGTWINVNSDADTTDFTVQCEPKDIVEVLRLEAQRITRRCDGVNEHWFSWLRAQVADEVLANNTRLTNRSVSHALYAVSDPHHRAYDATPDTVTALTRDQTCEFIDKHYAPANTLIVVSGPFTAPEFERIIERDLRAVPPHTVQARPSYPTPSSTGFTTKLSADVAEPTLAISWPLPVDEGDRAIMMFATDLLANELEVPYFTDERHVTLWLTDQSSVAVATEKVRTTLRNGLFVPKEFERLRSGRMTGMLAELDSVRARLREVAREVDLQEPFEALDQLNVQGMTAVIAREFDWKRARVMELEPDGTRPKWRPASLADPAHLWKGPSSFPDSAAPSLAPGNSNVLARARTFRLANGMTVVLAPTSPVPIIDIGLVFLAGVSAEPTSHRGTAKVAFSALQQIGKRGAENTSWAAGVTYQGANFDSGGFGVRGATMYADLLMQQFAGLTDATFQQADVQKGYQALVKTAASPAQRLWDEATAVRTTVFGGNHPYAQAREPQQTDVTKFDAREVERFYRRYLQPNNATLIVTGGFDPDVVAKLVHKTFDRWQGKGESVVIQTPAGKGATYASADRSNTVQLRIEWRANPIDQQYEARMVLGNMLNVTASRVGAGYKVRRQGANYILSGKFDPATAPAEIRALAERVAQLGSGTDFYRATFVSAQRRGVRATLAGGQSLMSWSKWILFAVENGRDLQWLGGIAKRIAAVSYDEVAKLANNELTQDRATWFVSGPRDAVDAVYAELGVSPTWVNP